MHALERKSIPMVAWYMLSNESYMKRVMSDVLPTVVRAGQYGSVKYCAYEKKLRYAYRSARRGRLAYELQSQSRPTNHQEM